MHSALDALAQLGELAGDGHSPNVYLVTIEERVQTATLTRQVAYHHWRALVGERPDVDVTLLDRETGLLCHYDPAVRRVTRDAFVTEPAQVALEVVLPPEDDDPPAGV